MAGNSSFSKHIDHAAVVTIVGGMTKEAVQRAADTTKGRARANVISMGLVNTGKLVNSFETRDVTLNPMKPKIEVYSTDKEAIYPEKGRGPIVAAPGKVLRFKPKGMVTFVFAKRVGPVRPYGFMRKAMLRLTRRDFLK
jgi:hypothetical protein